MATELERLKALIDALERLKALIDAEVASDEDKAQYEKLVAEAAKAPEPQTEGEMGPVVEVGVYGAEFEKAAEYVINNEGFFKSQITQYFEPATDKPQCWFIIETDDSKVPKPNRGVIVGEYGRGAGILRRILDSLEVPYDYNKDTQVLRFQFKVPFPCYADWARDPKGKAIGGVQVTGLRTLEAGAAVEKAI